MSWPAVRNARSLSGASSPKIPMLAQHPVEDLVVPCRAGEVLGLAVHQLQHVADGDVGDHAALGRDDLGGAAQREAHGDVGHVRVGVAQRLEAGEPFGVAGAGQVTGQAPLPAAPATRQLSEGRTRSPQVATTRAPDSSSRSHCDARPCSRCQAIGSVSPVPARRVGAAGHPALLPGPARLVGQPVQEPGQGALAPFLAVGVRQDEYPAGEPCRPRRVPAWWRASPWPPAGEGMLTGPTRAGPWTGVPRSPGT